MAALEPMEQSLPALTVIVSHIAVRKGKPYLYNSGGFVCSPKYRAEYKSIAKGLAVKSFACGCAIDVFSAEGFGQARYAEQFNNQVLVLLAEVQKKIRKAGW